ncbi:MAG: alanine--glyoxylate aminotransferase family protein [Spirochaetia bacterium]|jgi:alanine-glyoxylate transaminase/serine-glyoxylate transaminase/serine-pyruvate transaminase|nr:alanine--glyoxylate aminotransferase family protein [Spirochaetia bacterium]
MVNKLENVPEILLMGPGPSCVHPEVYKAIAVSTLGHMDPVFMDIMDSIKKDMQIILNTKNRCTVPMSGTGSAGMEACFVNLIEKGERVLILENGVFGKRMIDVASRLGAEVDALSFKWGTPVIVDDVKAKLAEKDYAIVAVVHAETSTGVRNPVAEISSLLKGKETLYLVDAVTSMGGIEIRMDDWGIDALYSGSQKCLSCPPGISPVSFSEKAVKKLLARKTKVPNWYLDLSMIINYWEGAKRVYHHTAPINMLYAMYQALEVVIEEGLENVYARHMKNHKLLVKGLGELGLKMLVEEKYRLPELNSVIVPEGVDEAAVRARLLKEFKIEIGAGLGDLAGKIWRIGLMGYTSSSENVEKILKALKACLNK